MSELNLETIKLVSEGNFTVICERGAGCRYGRRMLLYTTSLLAMTTAVLLSQYGVVAAQTRDGAPQIPASNAQVSQLPQVEMASSIQAAVDGLKQQENSSKPASAVKLAETGTQIAKPVSSMQTSNCINPHPGTAQQSQQQLDQCHVQIWFKYNDGCTGYKTASAQGGGGNCGNTPPSDEITWTYCAAKHTP